MNTQRLRVTCPDCLAPVDIDVVIRAHNVETFADGSAELVLDISPEFDHSCKARTPAVEKAHDYGMPHNVLTGECPPNCPARRTIYDEWLSA